MFASVLPVIACGVSLLIGGVSEAASLSRGLAACDSHPDKEERLACFEALAGGRRAVEGRDIDPTSSAGFGLVRQARRPQGGEREARSVAGSGRLEGVVAGTHDGSRGQLVLMLDDGAVWEQAPGDSTIASAGRGAKIEIRHGALGSYFMKIERGPTLRVRRVR